MVDPSSTPLRWSLVALKTRAEFPPKLEFLFQPHRHKVAYGGRAGAKSWNFARALIILGTQKQHRILCVREVQKSIKDSVHKLLSDQIEALGYGYFYTITETSIKGANGTEFMFAGLSNVTAASIKSYESVSICWCEEAQTLTKKSLDTLLPTIRQPGSEIWFSFNPDLINDEIYQRFVINPPPDTKAVHINYMDNEWVSEETLRQIEHAKKTAPNDFDNIWLGIPRVVSEGAIYEEEVRKLISENRYCPVPYDPSLKVHVVADLGWNDTMVFHLVQVVGSDVRIIDLLEDSHKTLDWYSAQLRSKMMNWGTMFLPHDGTHKDFKTGKSTKQFMEEFGWEVQIVPKETIEHGIRTVRLMFPRLRINSVNCEPLLNATQRYRRVVSPSTGEAGAPLHDSSSHECDCLRYVALTVDQMSNDTWGGQLNYPSLGVAA